MANQDFKVIFFDYFGVICVDQYQAWLAKSGHQPSGEYFALSRKADLDQLSMNDFFAGLSHLSGETAERIRTDFEKNTDLDHELLSLILRLKAKYQIGLITNSSTEWIEQAFDQFHTRPLFDTVIISAQVGLVKPQAKIYHLALEQAGVEADQAIFIDDSEVNVAGASKLGIKSILYQNLTQLRKELIQLGIDP